MLKRTALIFLCLALAFGTALALEDGVYEAEFRTDSSMFRANEATGGKGRLTVRDGRMTIHVTLASKNIVNLFPGTAEEAKAREPEWLQPTLDSVTYEDGWTEEAYGFDIPVPAADEEFDLAILGKKGKWYDHRVSVANPEPLEEQETGGIMPTGSFHPEVAEYFSMEYYEGGLTVIDVKDSARYLLLPEGAERPGGFEDCVPLRRPLSRVYLAATGAMAFFERLGCLDTLRFSSQRPSGWSSPAARAAMEEGKLEYAGKYSEPDYERLLAGGCDLAVESMMILHAPKAKEMLEGLGIPVFVDRSGSEPHPLGRAEWIRVYGALLDRREEADALFGAQRRRVEELGGFGDTGKRVAFFYLHSDGRVGVRGTQDYVTRIIEMAGGHSAFETLLSGQAGRTTVLLSMEDFYRTAGGAELLVYNGALDPGVRSLADLLAKEPLLADFRAVREGSVFLSGRDLYQAADAAGDLIADFRRMLTGETDGLTYLAKLE